MKYQDITILLVDDDEYHANMFKSYLHRKGINSQVKHFANSFSAEKYLFNQDIRHDKYNYLMLLDIKIPGLDLQTFSKKIDEQYKTGNIIIIALSESLAYDSINQHYYNMLSKPLVQNSFENKLSQLGIIIQNCKNSCTKKFVIPV